MARGIWKVVASRYARPAVRAIGIFAASMAASAALLSNHPLVCLFLVWPLAYVGAAELDRWLGGKRRDR